MLYKVQHHSNKKFFSNYFPGLFITKVCFPSNSVFGEKQSKGDMHMVSISAKRIMALNKKKKRQPSLLAT